MSLADWNARYSAREEIDSDPSPLVIEAAAGLEPGRALDLACGAGRNAVWLARQRWNVTAVDGAEEAIRIVHELDPSIATAVLDLEDGSPLPFDDGAFDLVAIMYFLHRPLFAEASRVLRPGGTVVSAIRMKGIDPRYCVRRGELRSFFEGWTLVHYDESDIAEIIATRP